MATLDPVDHQILLLKKRLQVNKMKQQDPGWQKRRSEKERLRRKAKRESDPEYKAKLNADAKEYYKKNPQRQIKSSTKWNNTHKDQKNATNRKSYEKNKVGILARRKAKRVMIRLNKKRVKELINNA